LRQRSYVQRRASKEGSTTKAQEMETTIIICGQGYRAVTTCCFCPEVSAVLQSRGGPWLQSWACLLGWSAWSWCRMPRDILQGSLMLAHASRHRAWWIRRLRTTRNSIMEIEHRLSGGLGKQMWFMFACCCRPHVFNPLHYENNMRQHLFSQFCAISKKRLCSLHWSNCNHQHSS